MTDLQFNFLIQVAQVTPEQREEFIARPDYQDIVKSLGNVSREVLNVLLGNRVGGNVAKAWLSLVTQAASQDTASLKTKRSS